MSNTSALSQLGWPDIYSWTTSGACIHLIVHLRQIYERRRRHWSTQCSSFGFLGKRYCSVYSNLSYSILYFKADPCGHHLYLLLLHRVRFNSKEISNYFAHLVSWMVNNTIYKKKYDWYSTPMMLWVHVPEQLLKFPKSLNSLLCSFIHSHSLVNTLLRLEVTSPLHKCWE